MYLFSFPILHVLNQPLFYQGLYAKQLEPCRVSKETFSTDITDQNIYFVWFVGFWGVFYVTPQLFLYISYLLFLYISYTFFLLKNIFRQKKEKTNTMFSSQVVQQSASTCLASVRNQNKAVENIYCVQYPSITVFLLQTQTAFP